MLTLENKLRAIRTFELFAVDYVHTTVTWSE